MSDIVCVVLADLPDERGYMLRGTHGKIEAILTIEKQAGFTADSLVRAEEPGREQLSWIVSRPGIDRFLEQQDRFIYLIAKFAGEAEEVERHLAVPAIVDASFTLKFSQRLLIRLWVASTVS